MSVQHTDPVSSAVSAFTSTGAGAGNHRTEIPRCVKCGKRDMHVVDNDFCKSFTSPAPRVDFYGCKIENISVKYLLGHFGSFRRMAEAYWRGELTEEVEHVIEDSVPKETLASYKPV